MSRDIALSICALSLLGAVSCGETYFQAGILVEPGDTVGDGDGDGDAGDGDAGDGDGSPATGGLGGQTGENPRPGSLGLDPLSAEPFDYLDCVPPPQPSGPPPPGGSVVSADTIIVYSSDDGFLGRFQDVSVQGQSFDTATRVEVIGTPINPWAAQMVRNTPAHVDSGDTLLADVWARCETPSPQSDVCQALLIVEDAVTFDKAIQFPIQVGSEWEHFFIPLAAPQDYPVGVGHTTLFLGYADQTMDIGPVTLRDYGSRNPNDLPKTPLTYPGMNPDDGWRETASTRIDSVRRGDIDLLVVDTDGNAIENAEIRVRMTRHEFLFGSAVSSELTVQNEEPQHTERYREEAIRLFNVVTPFNALRWQPWAGDWGTAWSKERGAAMVDWAEDAGLALRGYVLVNASWSQLPEFVESQQDDPTALAQAVLDRIDEAMELTRGRALHWDVLTNPHTDRDLLEILGEDVIVEWFERARAADPDAKLFLSDYGILSEGPGRNGHHETLDRLLALLANAPLDGLGFYGNFGHTLTGPEDVYAHLERYGTGSGKEIAITQYAIDVGDDQLAACFTHDFMTALFSHPSVSTFVTWGFWGDEDLIFGYDWYQKLAGRVYEDLVLQRWWTDETVATAADGSAKVRGFFGDYEITVSFDGQTETVRVPHARSTPTTVTFELPN